MSGSEVKSLLESAHHENLPRGLDSVCREVAGRHEIRATCVYGSRAGGYARPDSDYDVLLVLRNYERGLRFEYPQFGGAHVAILLADSKLLESDVTRGALGEFLSARLLGPYLPLMNEQYLAEQELRTKRRVVEEELREVVVRYGSMARGLLITPEYFALSRLRKMAGLYPALMYGYSRMLQGDLRGLNLPRVSAGYVKILKDLEKRGITRFVGENVQLQERFLDQVISRRSVEKIVNVLGMGKRVFYSYMSRGRAKDPEFETLMREVGSTLGRGFEPAFGEHKPEDPRNYIFLQTSAGLVSLAEDRSAVEAAQKLRPGVPITVTPLAGVLNEVYLVTAGEERFVLKRFTDWLTLKWFTLNMVTLGTKRFSLMGQSRLSNEYGMNRLLSDNGIPVPKIVHINLHERVLLQEFVEGLNVSQLVRRAAETDQISASDYQTAVALGRTLARIHSLDVIVGDSKPENFVATTENVINVLDLEQGERHGDPAWDVAVLLFYSGHYSPLMTQGLEQFVDGFVYGYSGEGDHRVLRKATSLTYLRVFSVWTSPQVLYKISQRLKQQQ